MTGDLFAEDWPGRGAWGRKQFNQEWGEGPRGGGPRGHRHQGPPNWFFAKARRHGLGPEDLEKIEDLIAWRRMRGAPFGAGGPGPFGHGSGGRGRGRGRARRGDVRLALLRLLAPEARHGHQPMPQDETRRG